MTSVFRIVFLKNYAVDKIFTRPPVPAVRPNINSVMTRYNDGVQWHDVPCFFRAKIICEDSEKQMKRIMRERGVDVRTPINDTSVWSWSWLFRDIEEPDNWKHFHLCWMSSKLTSGFCMRQVGNSCQLFSPALLLLQTKLNIYCNFFCCNFCVQNIK